MQFKIEGIIPSPELDDFRLLWTKHTISENGYLSPGRETSAVSTAQLFVIDLFTGHDKPYRDDEELGTTPPAVLVTVLPAQMELEALLRARSRALAEMLGRSR